MAAIIIALKKHVVKGRREDEDGKRTAFQNVDLDGDGKITIAEMSKALKRETVGVRADNIIQRIRLERDVLQMCGRLPIFVVCFALFVSALCTLADPTAYYDVTRRVVTEFDLQKLGSMHDFEELYQYMEKFETRNQHLQAVGVDFWCEDRYLEWSWDVNMGQPVKRCHSPRRYAIGKDTNPKNSWSNLPKCFGGGMDDGSVSVIVSDSSNSAEDSHAGDDHHRRLLIQEERRLAGSDNSTDELNDTRSFLTTTTGFGLSQADENETNVTNVTEVDENMTNTTEVFGEDGNHSTDSGFLTNMTDRVSTRVFLSLLVTNVNFYQLVQMYVVLANFVVSLQAALAQEAGTGIESKHVDIELAAGSVLVKAFISPPDLDSLNTVQARLASSISLASTVASSVAAVPGIERVSTGSVSVTDISAVQIVVGLATDLPTTTGTTTTFHHHNHHTHAPVVPTPAPVTPAPTPPTLHPLCRTHILPQHGVADVSPKSKATWPDLECEDDNQALQMSMGDHLITCTKAKDKLCDSMVGMHFCRKTCGFCGPIDYVHYRRFDSPQVSLMPTILYQTRSKLTECNGFAETYEDQDWNPKMFMLPAYDGKRHGRINQCVDRDSTFEGDYAFELECPEGAPCRDGKWKSSPKADFHGMTVYPRILLTPSSDLHSMRDMQWLDMQTKTLTLKTVLYSSEVEVFTSLAVTFTIDKAGNIDSSYDVKNFTDLHGETKSRFVTCLVLCLIGSLFAAIWSAWCIYNADEEFKWGEEIYQLVSRFVLFIYSLVFVIDWAVQAKMPYEYEHLLQEFLSLDPLDQAGSSKVINAFFATQTHIYDVTAWMNRHRLVIYVILYVQFIQLIMYFNAHPNIALLTSTVRKALSGIVHFLFVFVLVFTGLAFIAHWMLAEHIEAYKSMPGAFASQGRMIFGEFIQPGGAERLSGSHAFVYYLYAVTFALVMFFTLLNFFLAIVVDAFSDVQEETRQMVGVGNFFHDVLVAVMMCLVSRLKRWPSNGRLISYFNDVIEGKTPKKTWLNLEDDNSESDEENQMERKKSLLCTTEEVLDFFKPMVRDDELRPWWQAILIREPEEEGFRSLEDYSEFMVQYFHHSDKVLGKRKIRDAQEKPGSAASTATPGDMHKIGSASVGGVARGSMMRSQTAGPGIGGGLRSSAKAGGGVGMFGDFNGSNVRSSQNNGDESTSPESPGLGASVPVAQHPGIPHDDFSDDESWGEDMEDV
eukprot:TRINITY_DN8153_c0_g1_i1.p1 TRINITY_DN8153_c0_g1~~TRINITY_DN8153_c0_g1_i1.p1  ORF type:complete len:1222 (-),score=229.65 TRINITY_DN8153_c0_g1_i1:120-3785(-)